MRTKYIRAAAIPWRAAFRRQRVEHTIAGQPQIGRNGARQGRIHALAVISRGAQDLRQQAVGKVGRRRFTKDVEPVPDLQFLQITKIIVELQKLFGRVLGLVDPAIGRNAGAGGRRQNVGQERVGARAIHAGGFVIFVHLRFQLGHDAMAVGLGHRRGQMVDDDGCSAAFGLRALARIIDDERIEMRHRSQHSLGNAGGFQRQRLAGQPFEIAVLAEMHHGVNAEFIAHPPVEREVIMRRHQIRRVIGRLGIDVVAARRLHGDKQIPVAAKRKAQRLAVAHRIRCRVAPAVTHSPLQVRRQLRECLAVGTQRHGGVTGAPLPAFIGRPGAEVGDQPGAVRRHGVDGIAGIGHGSHRSMHTCRCVQPDTIGQTAIAVRIIRHDEPDPGIRNRPLAKPCPAGGKPGHPRGSVRHSLIGRGHGMGQRVAARRLLESDGSRQQPPVQFRKSDIHRQIARRQPGG